MAKYNVNVASVGEETVEKCNDLRVKIDECISTMNGISVPFTCDSISVAINCAKDAKNRTEEYKTRLQDAVEYFTECDTKFKSNVSGIETEKF